MAVTASVSNRASSERVDCRGAEAGGPRVCCRSDSEGWSCVEKLLAKLWECCGCDYEGRGRCNLHNSDVVTLTMSNPHQLLLSSSTKQPIASEILCSKSIPRDIMAISRYQPAWHHLPGCSPHGSPSGHPRPQKACRSPCNKHHCRIRRAALAGPGVLQQQHLNRLPRHLHAGITKHCQAGEPPACKSAAGVSCHVWYQPASMPPASSP